MLIICQLFTELRESTDMNGVIWNIDALLSLKHNTNSIFTKDKCFLSPYRAGCEWIYMTYLTLKPLPLISVNIAT